MAGRQACGSAGRPTDDAATATLAVSLALAHRGVDATAAAAAAAAATAHAPAEVPARPDQWRTTGKMRGANGPGSSVEPFTEKVLKVNIKIGYEMIGQL
jgi:hypothetical protein